MSLDLIPGGTIGILGGGQLGRMLALAAARLGIKVHIYTDSASPACEVAAAHTIAPYDDERALAEFVNSVDLITYEFENIPAPTATKLAESCLVRPGPNVLGVCQDRLAEKEFLAAAGVAAAPYMRVDDAGALARAIAQIGRPAILKTRRLGYDGKGQVVVREGADLAVTFRSLGGVPAILEAVVPFSKEISVVAARACDGAFAAYDICENIHKNHILKSTRVPAGVPMDIAVEAVRQTHIIADALDYCGVLAVEMFVTDAKSGAGQAFALCVNEIAPRVHNSGHWTLDGAITSQFEQHIRAVAGWPLGATERFVASKASFVEMENLIGEEVNSWSKVLADPSAKLHLYGKEMARPGRKMGHVTRLVKEPGLL
ncbi:MAG: 5-(carboxyamino)imidazole ribonucleotide synthase [Methylocapsa sp.]|nr:5-(carboxyamino)imidazole ribonucleotide synthase [Methylocapsa sp.]